MFEQALGTAAGGFLGGVTGQVGNALSAPRRALWSALGLPEHGNELIGQTFGLDPSGVAAKGLGLGAEVVLDPLTYLGMGLGKLGGGVYGAATAQEAKLASEIEALTAARRAAQEGLVASAANDASTVARYGAQAEGLGQLEQLPSMMGGKTRSYQAVNGGLADDMANAGFGRYTPEGTFETLGAKTPQGTAMRQMQTDQGGRMYGSSLQPGGPGAMDARTALPQQNLYQGMEPLLPDELAWMQDQTSRQLGNRWRSLGDAGSAYPQERLLDDFAHTMAPAANASRPVPTLGMAMRDQFRPTSGLSGALLDAPLPDAFEMAQKNLLAAQAKKAALQPGLADYLQVGGAGAAGAGMGYGVYRGNY